MELEIEKERTFNCPEGCFRAKFKGIREERKFRDGKLEKFARLTLEVEVPSIPDKIVTVARNFPPSLKPGSKLRELLESWLGRNFFEQNSGKKIDFDLLIDKEADILVHLIQNEGYAQPYRFLAEMYPPGTLPLGETVED